MSSLSKTAGLRSRRIALHASNVRVELVEEKLPLMPMSDNTEIRYLDPQLPAYTRNVYVEHHHFSRLGYTVISTQEDLSIPTNCFGMLQPAIEGAYFNSSILVYPGWSGNLAVEFKTVVERTLAPGDFVAYLYLFETPYALPAYQGKYNGQQFAEP
ncbi:MAG: hypothetical protein HY006_03790 [Candidatus Sungbacteria bacterium]|nr:hypothetical protein [Candidatus Sungbacteria bacterium]